MPEWVPGPPSVIPTIYVFVHSHVSSWYVVPIKVSQKGRSEYNFKIQNFKSNIELSIDCSGIAPRLSLTLRNLFAIYFMLILLIHYFVCKFESNLICRCPFQTFYFPLLLESQAMSRWEFIHKLERLFLSLLIKTASSKVQKVCLPYSANVDLVMLCRVRERINKAYKKMYK